MKDQIRSLIDQPSELEKLYRENKTAFTRAFNQIYPEISQSTAAQFWQQRLNYESGDITWPSGKEWIFAILLALTAGFIAKIQAIFGIDEEFYFTRNIGFIVLPALSFYFMIRNKLPLKTMFIAAAVIISAAAYINLLPANSTSDTLILSCIHLPLFLWAIFGFSFTGNQFRQATSRVDFLRFNGDLVVMTTVIVIAGAVLSGATVGLFNLIGMDIAEFYFPNIGMIGLSAAPILATFLIQTNPQLVKSVSPVIARVFTPLVLIMLVVYLLAIVYTGKDPYNDREFLLIFNVLLIGVMAIILFSLSENTKKPGMAINKWMLFLLSLVTIVLNGIALSAIIFRISEWGFTPNRLAVLGSNLLILTHLLIVGFSLFSALKNNNELQKVEEKIAWFLPVYVVWTVLVTFFFPFLFGFQ